jgi:hypothetical protein
MKLLKELGHTRTRLVIDLTAFIQIWDMCFTRMEQSRHTHSNEEQNSHQPKILRYDVEP